MSNQPHTTKLSQKLETMDRSGGWLGRQLGVSRQSANAWVTGREECPKARRAQIALTLGIKASEYFNAEGFAVPI